MKYRVVRHGSTVYLEADYVKFEGQFASFWKRAKDHSGGRDDLVVAYNADQIEQVDRVEKGEPEGRRVA